MKLELKHLTAYLPYKLKCQWNNIPYELISLRSNDRSQLIDFYTDEVYGVKLEFIKPILRPLSDLTKEIKHNEKKIKVYPLLFVDHFPGFSDINEADYFIRNPERLDTCYPLQFWNLLFEYHFDVYGLIKARLAIDINTLK